jgi:hypothetical protein
MDRAKDVAVRAVQLYTARRFSEAVDLCQREIQRSGPTPSLRLELGRALIALHRTEEAEHHLANCVRENPDCAPAYRMLSEIAFQRNRIGRAREYAEVAARMAPADHSNAILLQVVQGANGGARVSSPPPAPPRQEKPAPLFLVDSNSALHGAREETNVVSRDAIEAPGPRPDKPPLGIQTRRFGWGHVLGGVGLLAAAAAVLWVTQMRAMPPKMLAASLAKVSSNAPVVTPVSAPASAPATATPAPDTPDTDWTAEIAADTWIHPLSGPVRRMPIRDTRVFGAERPGDRPVECRSGHCGVDVGEMWGEPVLAVHSGVIDRVQRAPNPDHGGHYVRIAHRNGMVFTQYFHLAAIPRRIAPGVVIKAGEVVGILGDTGVKDSGPHLHFTVSVRPNKQAPERYIDPEPLIAIWPLHITDVAGTSTLRATLPPGVPRGAARGNKRPERSPAADPAE